VTSTVPKVAVIPANVEIERAVLGGGGVLSSAGDADAIVWMDPRDPAGLRSALSGSPARWVQLPFAGIESFLAAGVIDPALTWTCAKGIYGPATAEHAMALILAAARGLHRHARTSKWLRSSDLATRRLAGGVVLIIGTGGIGAALAEMLQPFGVTIVAANRSGKPVEWAAETLAAGELTKALPGADWVVVAAPLTAETKGLIDAEALGRMHQGAWLINVARGGLVDTDALVEALREVRIGGAALDVTDPEPLPEDHPLWSMENVIITSHQANTWHMALPDLADLVERNVRRFAAGEPLEGLVKVGLGY